MKYKMTAFADHMVPDFLLIMLYTVAFIITPAPKKYVGPLHPWMYIQAIEIQIGGCLKSMCTFYFASLTAASSAAMAQFPYQRLRMIPGDWTQR